MTRDVWAELLPGDCVDVMRDMKPGSVDLVVTSPPYDDLRDYGNVLGRWSQRKWEAAIDAIHSVLCQGGVCVWIVGDGTVKGGETGSSFRQCLYAMDAGLTLHDTMIWRKPNFSNPASTRYHQVFEYMFVWSKGRPKTFNPLMDRPNIYAGKAGAYGVNSVTQPDGSKSVRPVKINTDMGMRHNVWDMKTAGQDGSAKQFGHPAMFPVALARDHILTWSNLGDTVLDPFSGSGTTGVACLETGRNYIGIECNEDYMDIAEARLRATKSAISGKQENRNG